MTEEPRVRDIWKTLPHRAVVGDALVRRVGGRAWDRPRIARFCRFFERSGLPNPWDADGATGEIGLGEVGIAQRRAPAPHAAPPQSSASSGPKLPNIPSAPKAKAEATRDIDMGRPASRLGESRRDDTEVLRQRMMEKERAKVDPTRRNLYRVNQPLAKIPVRPGLDGAEAPPAPVATPLPMAVRPPVPAPAPLRPPPGQGAAAPKAPPRRAIEPARRPTLPDGPEELADEPGSFFSPGMRRPEPPPPPPMAPRVEEPASAAPSQAAPPATAPPRPAAAPAASTPPKPAPPVQRTAKPPGSGGMDDLFGIGSGETRIKMGAKPEADAQRARRPMVTSQEDLAKQGLDRRPPPPRPPKVTPTGGGGGGGSDGLPDE